jgi:hypothetical protein
MKFYMKSGEDSVLLVPRTLRYVICMTDYPKPCYIVTDYPNPCINYTLRLTTLALVSYKN